jgi:hypothetical protein
MKSPQPVQKGWGDFLLTSEGWMSSSNIRIRQHEVADQRNQVMEGADEAA